MMAASLPRNADIAIVGAGVSAVDPGRFAHNAPSNAEFAYVDD